jgi:hypothetical protein
MLGPNIGLEGSAQQLRCWVPASLRAAAPPQPGRWAACRDRGNDISAGIAEVAKAPATVPAFGCGGTLLSTSTTIDA